MKRIVLSFLLVASAAGNLGAQTVDKAKLREGIQLPFTSAGDGLDLSLDRNIRDDSGNPRDLVREIAEKLKQLKGTVADAEILLDIGERYERINQAQCTIYYKKAKDLLQPHLNKNSPQQGNILLWYCRTLWHTVPDPVNECKQHGIKAMQLAPQDWRGWADLGYVCIQHITRIVLGTSFVETPVDTRDLAVFRKLESGDIDPERIAEVEKYLGAARQFMARARQLAPEVADCRHFYLTYLMFESNCQNAIAAKEISPVINAEFCAENQAMARLLPDCMFWQSTACILHHALFLHEANKRWQLPLEEQKKFDLVLGSNRYPRNRMQPSPPQRKSLDEYLLRLDKIAGKATPSAGATFCHAVLMVQYAMLQEHGNVEEYARRVVAADSNVFHASEFLEDSLRETKRRKQASEVADERLKRNPTARGYFLRARYSFEDGKHAECEKLLRAGLHKNPDDMVCVLSLATALMKGSDKSEAWTEAGQLLNRAADLVVPETPWERHLDLRYLKLIHEALTGDATLARVNLEKMRRDAPDDERLQKALTAFGK